MAQSPQLSNREWEVVELLLQGKSNKLIASSLSISERTVEFHLKNIYDKFDVSSRVELILKLGNAADRPESEKPGFSTVDQEGESIENGGGPNSQMNWVTSLKASVSMIGEDSGLKSVMNVKAQDEAGNMSFLEAIRVCLTKYAEFNGRAGRAEFWWFMLFVVLVAGALLYVSEALSSIFLIAVLLPLLAVGARRLRDIGKSGWWLLMWLVPVGGLVALVWLWSLPGTAQPVMDEGKATNFL
jgi:DNA-binding CsgD family transcriptional regulator